MSAARKAGLQGDLSVVPNVRQDEILNAYLDNPNAAAVARSLKTNDRHVRRLVKQFADVLEERRRERLERRQERADARLARSEALADAMLDSALQRLNQLSESSNESIAIRAVRIKLDLALRRPPTNLSTGTAIDVALEGVQQDLVREIIEVDRGFRDGREAGP